MVLHEFEYTVKDCACAYCHYYTGRGRNKKCSLDCCDCMKERIAAGAASYKETITEIMSAIRYPPLALRLEKYFIESEGEPMDYRNEKHRIAFADAIQKLNRKNRPLMAALYLLTADHRLWSAAKEFVRSNEIDLNTVKIPGCTENAYTLLCAAKDLYLGTKHLSVCDLADESLVPPKTFRLICNAMAIRRFGLGALESMKRGEKQC